MMGAAGDFVERMGRSGTADEVFEALLDFSKGLGFDCALAGEILPAAPGEDPVLLSCRVRSFEDEFDDYVRSGMFRHDPLFAEFGSATRPFVNEPHQLRAGADAPGARALLSYEMIATKARLTFPPILGSAGSVWAMSFGKQNPGQALTAFLDEVSATLWLASSAAAVRMSALDRCGPVTENPLTPRERECLLRLARGDRVDRIADRLGLSNATVELHLAKARRRLGARTSPEAVAKAVLAGWIEP